MNIDIHAIVRPRVGKHAGKCGLVEGFTRTGKATVTIPIQRDGTHMDIATVRYLPADLFLVETGQTIDRWAKEEKAAEFPRLKRSNPMDKTIDPYDGLENEEMPADPAERKRLQERIATRRRLREMSKKQRNEYYERRKQIRTRSREKKRARVASIPEPVTA